MGRPRPMGRRRSDVAWAVDGIGVVWLMMALGVTCRAPTNELQQSVAPARSPYPVLLYCNLRQEKGAFTWDTRLPAEPVASLG